MIEKILCSAIWYKELNNLSSKWKEVIQFSRPVNITEGIVFCGHRHPHCMYQMIAMTGKRSVLTECGEYEQGFLTNKNRFVSREEAAIIAKLAGQLNSDRETKTLYSEDLY